MTCHSVGRFVWALLLLCCAVAQADQVQLSDTDLKRMGVYERGFRLADVSRQGDLLVGLERPRASERRRGLRQRLWLLRPQSRQAREIALTVPGVRQALLTPDESRVVLLTEGGTLLTLALQEESPRLMATAADLQGVVLERLLRGPGGLFALGRDWEGEEAVALARLEPGSQIPVGLVPLPALPPGLAGRVEWGSSDEGYVVYQGRLHRVGGEGQPKGLSDGGEWFALAPTPRGCFAIGDGLYWFTREGQGRRLAQGRALLGNLVTSADGNRVAVCDIDLQSGTMTVLTGKAPDFELRPVAELVGVPLGKVLLSPAGGTLIFRSPQGLSAVSLD